MLEYLNSSVDMTLGKPSTIAHRHGASVLPSKHAGGARMTSIKMIEYVGEVASINYAHDWLRPWERCDMDVCESLAEAAHLPEVLWGMRHEQEK